MSPNAQGNITNAPLFVDSAHGNLRLQSDSPCINAGNNAYVTTTTDLDGRPRIVGGTVDMGAYEYRALLVWPGSPTPVPPYATWTTAATNIQDAVDAAIVGDNVVVTNGIYAGGVSVTNALTLLSVSGAPVTIIDGGGTNRCASLTDGASLSGFTLTNGYASGGGGGVWCASSNAFLTNCVIVGNSADYGGGALGGMLYKCTLSSNSATGSFFGVCGGGACAATLYNCTLTGNNGANGAGGGANGGSLYNCTLSGNSATVGGGVGGGTLYNCTLTGNSAQYGGGAWHGTFYNCIVCFNAAPNGPNYSYATMNYCCTTPDPGGAGNITVAPQFVDYASGNLRLQPNSPCINAGNNAYLTTATDLDSNPRIVSGTVDLGAYEYQGTGSVISYAWLQHYGLPTDGSADFLDLDHDGMNNYQEWVCGTNPTDALSVLRMVSAQPTSTHATVTWQSVAGINYFLQRSTNLTVPSTLMATNIMGQAGTTTYADTTATGAGPFFYRVGVTAP